MGIGFKIFLYGFLGIVASILIYNLVRLFRSIKPVECRAEKLLSQQVETDTVDSGLIEKISAEVKEENLRKALLKEIDQPGKEKPKGFWKRLWDNVEPYQTHSRLGKLNRFGDETDDMFILGVLTSSIYHRSMSHDRYKF